MSSKTPVRATFSGSNVTGLAEYQSGEFIPLTHGGLGASLSIGSAGQVLKVNGAGNAIEFGAVEAIVNIDNATDLESATLAAGDKILLSDGGTEGRVLLSQLDTLFSGTSKTLTNKTIVLGNNTVSGALANGITATTQSASDNSTKVATTAYVDNQVTAGATNEFADNVFRVKDNSDASKKLAFECSGISGSTTRTMTVPNTDGTISTESFATAIAVALG